MVGNMTIVFTDGHEEKYEVFIPESFREGTEQLHIKKMLEDNFIKLFVDETQMVLIPVSSIRKLIFQDSTSEHIASKEFPGFLHVKPME